MRRNAFIYIYVYIYITFMFMNDNILNIEGWVRNTMLYICKMAY